MKLGLLVSLLPLFAGYIFSAVSAYSIEGYTSNDVMVRPIIFHPFHFLHTN